MEFQLGESILQGSRAEILDQVSAAFMKGRLTYDGATLFGGSWMVIRPGENVISRIRDAYEIHKGKIIINGLYYNGSPAELKEIVRQQCVPTNIKFSGTISFGGFIYECSHLPLSSASHALKEGIIKKVPIEGDWNNVHFEGLIEDVRQRLTDYIGTLPMTVQDDTVTVGKSEVRLWHLDGKSRDFIEEVTSKLVDRAIKDWRTNEMFPS